MSEAQPKLRLDKWLWQARFFKTRSLAAKQVGAGHVRVNGNRALKPAFAVGPGDVLTFAQGHDVRVVRVVALGERRGPAPEAQTLFDDLTEKREKKPDNPKYEGKGRPSKRERRALDLSRRSDL
ncbi:RNA-binding S4 domain-containing protein [Phaeobacter gallaeciensis]|uniref:RNA-binding S4 domain-containing protein n=2 Tax=Roseobacteraceae TaxID=2854170 RepID=A0A366WVV3_9RHOB|nr:MULTISPECIES: RNA-binding S4 domain-containing protein [Roseobacteraceae]MBT3140961.1 RNA-binding S4 domain-containing protein [Falsiruegeria litorea]MBT8170705.1 RNA-binding S4 domain-containing protein [Falsiruegeria litorea]RBW52901.1 RNA-binding S4 domain-containing protein [Phaeobacter gallaeciensis]